MRKIITLFAFAFCLNANAQIITTVCGNGTAGYSGDGGQATGSELYWPAGVTFDIIGNLYIADANNSCIRKINTAGIITTFAGNSLTGFSGDNGPATAAQLSTPFGAAIDAIGNIYIADYGNYRIRKVNTAGIITTFAGTSTPGYSGDNGPATAAQFNAPRGIACDVSGNVYVADLSNSVIRIVNTNGIISTFAGNGAGSYSGDNGPAMDAALNEPEGVTLDVLGNLYIADRANSRVRKVNTDGIITTVAGNGTFGYSGDNGLATLAALNIPAGVAFDIMGNMYIADFQNNRIRKVNTVGIITTIAGDSIQSYGGDNASATAAELDEPEAVACDAIGNVYIADFQNNRIRKVTNVGQPLGIQQFANNNEQVSIYPNPTSSIINVELKMKDVGNAHYTLYDINGRAVKQSIIYNPQFLIDVSNLNEGVYNISLQSKEGVVNKRLVIVR